MVELLTTSIPCNLLFSDSQSIHLKILSCYHSDVEQTSALLPMIRTWPHRSLNKDGNTSSVTWTYHRREKRQIYKLGLLHIWERAQAKTNFAWDFPPSFLHIPPFCARAWANRGFHHYCLQRTLARCIPFSTFHLKTSWKFDLCFWLKVS